MKSLFTLLLTMFFGLAAFATIQYPDKIIYKGKVYDLQDNPLESYFDKNPDKRPEFTSTALWHGYRATFELKDGQLYLKDIEILFIDTTVKDYDKRRWKSIIHEIFPDQIDAKMSWLTCILVMPYGEADFNNIDYKNYILLEIDKGDLKKEEHLKYKEYVKFKEKQFKAFKKTDEYEKVKAIFKDDYFDDDEELIDEFIKDDIFKYTPKILIK